MKDSGCREEVNAVAKGSAKSPKGTPKQDGSGKGVRANRGRGGCKDTKSKGQGANPKKK